MIQLTLSFVFSFSKLSASGEIRFHIFLCKGVANELRPKHNSYWGAWSIIYSQITEKAQGGWQGSGKTLALGKAFHLDAAVAFPKPIQYPSKITSSSPEQLQGSVKLTESESALLSIHNTGEH